MLRSAAPVVYDVRMITPAQCRAARGLLQWTREQLAKESGLSVTTVTAFELESRQSSRTTIAQLTGALEAAGIAFAFNNNREAGVSLRK